jgi:toxin ParE1/3/4
LGDKFLDRVLETIDGIGENPKGYAALIKDVRRANVRQFPYGLWFRIDGDAVVIACLHGSRDPRLAMERALGVLGMPKAPDPG